MKYESVTYGVGFSIEVTPPDRSVDVMHNLITGGLLGDRSLEGVAVKEIDNPAYKKLMEKRAKELMRDMRNLPGKGKS